MTTTIKLIAINSIQTCDGTESEVTGYREDGSPIIKLIRHVFEPGEIFEANVFDAGRFVDLGVATTDLSYVVPEHRR